MERLRNLFENLRKYAFAHSFKLSVRKEKKFRN